MELYDYKTYNTTWLYRNDGTTAVNADTMYGTGQLPKFEEDLFKSEKKDYIQFQLLKYH